MTTHNDNLDAIEFVMDCCQNPSDFLEVVAEVFSAKADHLRETWQDSLTAEMYDLFAGAMLEAPHKVEKALKQQHSKKNA